jgi:hypothetical protein
VMEAAVAVFFLGYERQWRSTDAEIGIRPNESV